MKVEQVKMHFTIDKDIADAFNQRFSEIGGGTTVRINHTRRNRVLMKMLMEWIYEDEVDMGMSHGKFSAQDSMGDWNNHGDIVW